MKCRCGKKAHCVAKESEYCDDREIGVWRRYECKYCGFTFDTVEHLEDKRHWDYNDPVILIGER